MADTIYAMVNANPTVHAVSGFNEEGHPLLACGFASHATHMAWLNPNAEGVTCEECLNLRATDPYREATLAVLHLHRPSEFDGTDGSALWCNECDCAYPCPTTETIHRTLNGEKNA